MKLATLDNGTRDGQLLLVSTDMTQAVAVSDIAPTLQHALDNWALCSPKLADRYSALCAKECSDIFALDKQKLLAPLPRAYQWADGSAYVNHVELVRKARGAELPESFWHDPLMYQGGSDHLIGPHAPIEVADESYGIDFEAEVAVITDDVPMGVSAEDATNHIALIAILNDVSLRNLIPGELAKGFGFFHAKPATAFSACAVTPDELGSAWDGKTIRLPLISTLNGKRYGDPQVDQDMTFHFGQLIAHAAKTRSLTAGSIIGSGTISNHERSRGSSCIAEQRMIEKIETGEFASPFMKFGDTIRIEMLDSDGKDIFGAIDQVVTQYEGP